MMKLMTAGRVGCCIVNIYILDDGDGDDVAGVDELKKERSRKRC